MRWPPLIQVIVVLQALVLCHVNEIPVFQDYSIRTQKVSALMCCNEELMKEQSSVHVEVLSKLGSIYCVHVLMTFEF